MLGPTPWRPSFACGTDRCSFRQRFSRESVLFRLQTPALPSGPCMLATTSIATSEW